MLCGACSSGFSPLQAYEIASSAAQCSADLYPSVNGDYLDQLGVVERWKAFHHNFADPTAADSRRAALENFHLAVAVRPIWPSTWINMAKAYLMEFAAGFDVLQQTANLGPRRGGINRSLSELGFISWPYIAQQQRALVPGICPSDRRPGRLAGLRAPKNRHGHGPDEYTVRGAATEARRRTKNLLGAVPERMMNNG